MDHGRPDAALPPAGGDWDGRLHLLPEKPGHLQSGSLQDVQSALQGKRLHFLVFPRCTVSRCNTFWRLFQKLQNGTIRSKVVLATPRHERNAAVHFPSRGRCSPSEQPRLVDGNEIDQAEQIGSEPWGDVDPLTIMSLTEH